MPPDMLMTGNSLPSATPYQKPLLTTPELKPAASPVPEPIAPRPKTFLFKTPPQETAPPPAPTQQSPVMQQVDQAVFKQRFPEIQRSITPQVAQKVRENFGGNDDLTLKNLYGKDPAFRAEVDRYVNGDMSSLSQDAQNHFPSFILNAHYFSNPNAELPPNMDITRDPTRKGQTWSDWIRHVVTTPVTLAAGGIADAGQGVLDDFADVYHLATGQAYDFSDTDPLAWSRKVQSALDPNYSFESTVQTAATQAQIGASFLGPLGLPLSAAAGAARDVAGKRMQGEDPTLLNAGVGAAKGLASQYIASKLSAEGVLPNVANPAGSLGRIINAGAKGSIIGGAIGGTTGAIDIATGEKTVKDAATDTAVSAGVGLVTGAGFQSAMEAPNIVRSGYSMLRGFPSLSAAKKYELAVQAGGEEGKLAMAKGVGSQDVTFLADAPPEARDVFQSQHAIAREKLLNPYSAANIEQPQGALGIAKLQEVINIQDRAGEALGTLREGFDTTPELDINPVRNNLVKFFAGVGITNKGAALVTDNSILDAPATNALKLLWAETPTDGIVSQATADELIQAANRIIQNTDIDESAARGAMGAFKQGVRKALADSLDDVTKPVYLQATGDYANTMDILTEAKKALPYTGRIGGQYSLHQFKQDVLSGDLDLRMGQLARGLSSKTEGMKSPFFSHLEAATDNQVYVTKPDGTPMLVVNEKLSPYAEKTFDAKMQPVVEYGARLEHALGMQKTTSFGGETKAANGVGTTPASWLKSLFGLFKKTPETIFNAQDEFLNSLQAGDITPVMNTAAASTELVKLEEARRSDMLQTIKSARESMSGENRLLGLKGGEQGVAGLDFPDAPATPSVDTSPAPAAPESLPSDQASPLPSSQTIPQSQANSFSSVKDATATLFGADSSNEAIRAAKDYLHSQGIGNYEQRLPQLIKLYGSEDAIPGAEADILEYLRVKSLGQGSATDAMKSSVKDVFKNSPKK